MLVIRTAQLGVFSEALRLDFEARLGQEIRRLLAEGGLSADMAQLQVQVQLGVAEAEEYGLRAEREVARFVAIRCIELGSLAGRPLPAKAAAILRGYHCTGQRKLDDFAAWVTAYRRRQAALGHG